MLVIYVLHALMCVLITNILMQSSHVMTSINYMNIREPKMSLSFQSFCFCCVSEKNLLQQKL